MCDVNNLKLKLDLNGFFTMRKNFQHHLQKKFKLPHEKIYTGYLFIVFYTNAFCGLQMQNWASLFTGEFMQSTALMKAGAFTLKK